MMLRELSTQRQRLDELFEKARQIQDLELQAHWSRYLCVLVSGYIENSVRLLLFEYAKKRAQPIVASYVLNRIEQFQNPTMGAILELMGRFSQDWKNELAAQTEGELKESVNSIVGLRHRIAHGASVDLSMVPMTRYYRNAVKVVELIELCCNP